MTYVTDYFIIIHKNYTMGNFLWDVIKVYFSFVNCGRESR